MKIFTKKKKKKKDKNYKRNYMYSERQEDRNPENRPCTLLTAAENDDWLTKLITPCLKCRGRERRKKKEKLSFEAKCRGNEAKRVWVRERERVDCTVTGSETNLEIESRGMTCRELNGPNSDSITVLISASWHWSLVCIQITCWWNRVMISIQEQRNVYFFSTYTWKGWKHGGKKA